jgi:hypothetical protein
MGIRVVAQANKSRFLMTFQEALEYMNLPASCSRQLIRKRYLELKKDYLKAIYNAPSDHFSTLYRENLDKIEEAYNLLTEASDHLNYHDTRIQQQIQQIGQIVDSFLGTGGQLTVEGKEKIKRYIDQINELQHLLKAAVPMDNPSDVPMPPERGDIEKVDPANIRIESPGTSYRQSTDNRNITKPDERSTKNTSENWRWEATVPKEKDVNELKITKSALIENWVIHLVFQSSYAATSGSRRTFLNQVIFVAILIMLILVITGLGYLLSPLLFPAGK